MNEHEKTAILQRLSRLEAEVAELKNGKSAAERAAEFERLPDTATVGKEYMAYRFGCSIEAVRRKRAGTHRIKLKSERPMKAIKRDVDAAWREMNKPASTRAAEERAKAKPRRRRSIITKKQAA